MPFELLAVSIARGKFNGESNTLPNVRKHRIRWCGGNLTVWTHERRCKNNRVFFVFRFFFLAVDADLIEKCEKTDRKKKLFQKQTKKKTPRGWAFVVCACVRCYCAKQNTIEFNFIKWIIASKKLRHWTSRNKKTVTTAFLNVLVHVSGSFTRFVFFSFFFRCCVAVYYYYFSSFTVDRIQHWFSVHILAVLFRPFNFYSFLV